MPDHCKKEAELATSAQQIIELEKDSVQHRQTIEKIFRELKELNSKVGKLNTSTAVLWYKTGFIGLMGGAIPAVVTLIILIITGRI